MDVHTDISVTSDDDEHSSISDSVLVDNQQLIEDIANDYSKFLDFDLTREKRHYTQLTLKKHYKRHTVMQAKFCESVEDMLTKLDEFCGMVDMIRSDTTLCLTRTVPDIHAKCCEMEQIFNKIDRLETFVGVVRKHVSKMEECVCKAEDDLTTMGGFMRKITSIVSPKRSQKHNKGSEQSVFVPPEIFETNAYFAPVTPQGRSTEGAAVAVEGVTAVVEGATAVVEGATAVVEGATAVVEGATAHPGTT